MKISNGVKEYHSTSPERKEKIVKEIREIFAKKEDIVFAVVFGSFLSAPTFRDIDVGIYSEKIEKESGKKNAKWNKSRHDFRKAYIEEITKTDSLKGKIFFDVFSDTKKYIELTSFAAAKAILKKSGKDDYKVTVFVDGLKKKEIEVFSKGLKDLRIRTRKIRGVKKDENNAFIRLVDAICGLVRDKNDGNVWAEKALVKLEKEKQVCEL